MPSNYEEITRYNKENLGKDTASRRDQVCMYSDQTHFVYEILQNADDYGATEVAFRLLPDQLIIEHNGEPFTTENVKAISYIGKSTSRDDLVKTGRFGLGFKSVFAYTASPVIHSRDEHFQIHGLYQLRKVSIPSDLADSQTRIILPFDHQRERPDYVEDHTSAENAYKRVSGRLKQLNMSTLLFTRNIREVRWSYGSEYGHYLREDTETYDHNELLRQRKTTITDGDRVENYLIFARKFFWRNKQHKPVEVAFRLDENDKMCEANEPLFVLFSTKTERRLKFILNGPYRTNPARETVSEDDAFNRHLIGMTAILVGECLPILKDMRLLDTGFMEVLPIKPSDFEKNVFRPIFSRLKKIFQKLPLLPTDDDDYVSASQIKIAGSDELRRLLSNEQLQALFESDIPIKWLRGEMSQDLKGYLMSQVGVEEVDGRTFARKVGERFLKNQSNGWMAEFYSFLNGQEALWRPPRWQGDPDNILRSKPIIRLQDGRHVTPFREKELPSAYLPPTAETQFDIVKKEIASHPSAQEFLRKLGFSEPNIADEVIENILPKYQCCNPDISKEQHRRDIEIVCDAIGETSITVEKKGLLVENIKRSSFLRAVNASTGHDEFQKPPNLYVRSPELEIYFQGNPDAWFLADGYEPYIDKLGQLGITKEVRVSCRQADADGRVPIHDGQSTYARGLRGFDPECQIDGLEFALTNPTLDRSKYIWNTLSCKHFHRIRGTIERSTRQSFMFASREERYSIMGNLLIGLVWLPGPTGQFHKPSNLSLEDLPKEFERDEMPARQLGMKFTPKAILAKETGLSEDDINLIMALKENPELYYRFRKLRDQRPEFPERVPENPERRRAKLVGNIRNMPGKKYEERKRSVRVSEPDADAQTWLRNQYTNNYGQLICQMCEDEMPFKKRDGQYYFEAVEVLDDIESEHHELFLALCPICAAKYKEFVKRGQRASEPLKSAILESDSAKIPLRLGERESSIRFVQTHFEDLQTILKEIGQPNSHNASQCDISGD